MFNNSSHSKSRKPGSSGKKNAGQSKQSAISDDQRKINKWYRELCIPDDEHNEAAVDLCFRFLSMKYHPNKHLKNTDNATELQKQLSTVRDNLKKAYANGTGNVKKDWDAAKEHETKRISRHEEELRAKYKAERKNLDDPNILKEFRSEMQAYIDERRKRTSSKLRDIVNEEKVYNLESKEDPGQETSEKSQQSSSVAPATQETRQYPHRPAQPSKTTQPGPSNTSKRTGSTSKPQDASHTTSKKPTPATSSHKHSSSRTSTQGAGAAYSQDPSQSTGANADSASYTRPHTGYMSQEEAYRLAFGGKKRPENARWQEHYAKIAEQAEKEKREREK